MALSFAPQEESVLFINPELERIAVQGASPVALRGGPEGIACASPRSMPTPGSARSVTWRPFRITVSRSKRTRASTGCRLPANPIRLPAEIGYGCAQVTGRAGALRRRSAGDWVLVVLL